MFNGFVIMTNLFYRGLTWNSEIRNTLVWVLSNILRVQQVRGTKFSAGVSNEMFLNVTNVKGTTFTVSELKNRAGCKPSLPPRLLSSQRNYDNFFWKIFQS